MKFSIKTNNTEMTFDLRQEEAESLVLSALRYAYGNQPCQETPEAEEEYGGDPEYGGYQEDAGYQDGAAAEEEPQAQETDGYLGQPEEPVGGVQPGADGWSQPDASGGDPDMGQEGQEPQTPAPWVPQELKPRGYKGFLLIKCRKCGKLKAFCAKTPIGSYICDCGGTTPIQNLVSATAACECGKIWRYRTNADDQTIEVRCIACGSPIDLVWNDRRGKYVTIGA